MIDKEKLVLRAKEAQKNSYAPYSGFNVGACLLSKSGKVYTGCNVENSSYSLTCCAERVAFFSAIKEGEKAFDAIAIVGGKNYKSDDFCPPCGACRQVMTQFCDDNFLIILSKDENSEIKTFTLSQLMPQSFNNQNLK